MVKELTLLILQGNIGGKIRRLAEAYGEALASAKPVKQDGVR